MLWNRVSKQLCRQTKSLRKLKSLEVGKLGNFFGAASRSEGFIPV